MISPEVTEGYRNFFLKKEVLFFLGSFEFASENRNICDWLDDIQGDLTQEKFSIDSVNKYKFTENQ